MYYTYPDLNLFQIADRYAQFERADGNEDLAKQLEEIAEECIQRYVRMNKDIDCLSGNYKSCLHYSNIKRVILQKWSQLLKIKINQNERVKVDEPNYINIGALIVRLRGK